MLNRFSLGQLQLSLFILLFIGGTLGFYLMNEKQSLHEQQRQHLHSLKQLQHLKSESHVSSIEMPKVHFKNLLETVNAFQKEQNWQQFQWRFTSDSSKGVLEILKFEISAKAWEEEEIFLFKEILNTVSSQFLKPQKCEYKRTSMELPNLAFSCVWLIPKSVVADV